MHGKVIVFGVLLVLLVAMLVCMLELFNPLSARFDMNSVCREAMLRMELEGTLAAEARDSLESRLAARGFSNIVVQQTGGSKQGDEITLNVAADYVYSQLTGIFTREGKTQHMTYQRTALLRKVIVG